MEAHELRGVVRLSVRAEGMCSSDYHKSDLFQTSLQIIQNQSLSCEAEFQSVTIQTTPPVSQKGCFDLPQTLPVTLNSGSFSGVV
jgi:hypothetical protein